MPGGSPGGGLDGRNSWPNRWLVDMGLEKFSDGVNHDVLMSRLARRIKDRRILRLIRRYLQAGMMAGGWVSQRTQGTPPGGQLSPLLSDVLLDELDQELERRGHRFARYADDCNICVRSRHAGQRVLASIERFLRARLRLAVNREKSAGDRPWKRKFLGYTFTVHYQPRKLRAILWRQWKRPWTRAKNLIRRGLVRERAWISATNGRGPWWCGRTGAARPPPARGQARRARHMACWRG